MGPVDFNLCMYANWRRECTHALSQHHLEPCPGTCGLRRRYSQRQRHAAPAKAALSDELIQARNEARAHTRAEEEARRSKAPTHNARGMRVMRYTATEGTKRGTSYVICPFCTTRVLVHHWSLAGSGKRCTCGVIFGYFGTATDDNNCHGFNSTTAMGQV